MKPDVYKQLFAVMKNRRGPYTGIDIPEFYPLVQELFTPEEAQVNNAMPRKPVTANDIAKELGKPENDIIPTLETMADRGLCKTFLKDNVRYYQGEPFMPGIFETVQAGAVFQFGLSATIRSGSMHSLRDLH